MNEQKFREATQTPWREASIHYFFIGIALASFSVGVAFVSRGGRAPEARRA